MPCTHRQSEEIQVDVAKQYPKLLQICTAVLSSAHVNVSRQYLHGLPGEKGDISLEVEWLAPLGMHTWQSFASFKNMRMTERVLKPGGMSVSKCREV